MSGIVLLLFVILNGTAALTTSARLGSYLRQQSELELLQDAVEINRQLESIVLQKQELLKLFSENLNLSIAIKRERPDILEELFASWKQSSGFLEFLLADSDGRQVAVGNRTQAADLLSRPWYADVMEHGVSRIYYDTGPDGRQQAVFWMMFPFTVRSARHALIAKISWQNVASFLDQNMQVRLQNREKFYLILDHNFRLLYLPPFLQGLRDHIRGSLSGSLSLRTLRNAVEDRPTGNLHTVYFVGQDNCVGYVRSEKYSWLVLSLRNEEKNKKAITQIYWSSLRINLLILVAGLGVFSFFIWKLASPLRQLITVTSEIVRGIYPDKIAVPEDREIRLIVEAINLMIAQVRQQKSEVDYLYEQEKKASKNLCLANDLLAQKSDELSMKNRELQKAFDELRMLQEDLLKAERLAVVGETSGRVAHEVLNPVTAILFRVEQNLQENPLMLDWLKGFREVLDDWQRELENGTFADYFNLKGEAGLSYGEEDLQLLLTLSGEFEEANKGQQENFQFIFKQIQRVIKIINTLRESTMFSRSVSRFRCSVPLLEACDLLRDSLQKRDITVEKVLPEVLPCLDADLTDLIQVFTNLLRNAMQSVEQNEEGRSITADIRVTDDDWIEIRISDNGVGIPSALQTTIFEHHFTTKEPGEGTGLGLGISRKIIRSYGGELTLEQSCEGRGSTFLVVFPGLNGEEC